MSGSSLGGEKPGAGCSTLRGALAGHHLVVVLLGAHQPATTTPPLILARTPFLPRVSTLSVGAPFQQLPIILGESLIVDVFRCSQLFSDVFSWVVTFMDNHPLCGHF